MHLITVIAVRGERFKWRETEIAVNKTVAALPIPARSVVIEDPSINGIEDYSRYILTELWKHVATEFALVVQWDGYAINPSAWTNQFLKWDYIGAPWPISMAGETCRVGNGGFSLRSRKWLLAGKSLPPWKMEAEDVFCCRSHPGHWTQQGCRIAPIDLAARFSIEHPIPEKPHWNPTKSFGFHGFFHPELEKYRPC